MPMYEYQCGQCRTTFEELIRNDADERRLVCPECGHKKVARVPSVFAAHGATSKPLPSGGGCGRCGDPNGSCPWNG